MSLTWWNRCDLEELNWKICFSKLSNIFSSVHNRKYISPDIIPLEDNLQESVTVKNLLTIPSVYEYLHTDPLQWARDNYRSWNLPEDSWKKNWCDVIRCDLMWWWHGGRGHRRSGRYLSGSAARKGTFKQEDSPAEIRKKDISEEGKEGMSEQWPGNSGRAKQSAKSRGRREGARPAQPLVNSRDLS